MIMKCRDVSYCRMDESHAFADQVDEAVSLTFQTYERPKGKKHGEKSLPSLSGPITTYFFCSSAAPGSAHWRRP